MTRPRLPENWEELMADYVLGNLSSPDAEEFKRLLETYSELEPEVNQLQEVLALMPYSLPKQEPPPHLRAAILAAASREVGQREAVQNHIPTRRKPWIVWTGAIAALLVGSLAVDNYYLRRELQDARAFESLLRQPNTLVYALKGAGDTPAASGRVMFNAEQRQAIVVVQDLPELPPDRLYRLWAITAKGDIIYCGQFAPHGSRNATERLMTSPSPQSLTVAEMRITQEVANAPPIPKGPAVLSSAL